MGKKKLLRFAEMRDFENVVQAGADQVYGERHPLCGKWAEAFFRRSGPLVLELGCGKGEYTIELAKMMPEKNFLGVDIKGARIWKGARYALDNGLENAGFLRTRIEMISSFFAQDEVDEIWLTFPDPQVKKARKRLTAPQFLCRYRGFLKPGGLVHLKTDSAVLYEYTLSLLEGNRLEIDAHTNDLYGNGTGDPVLDIRTFYEKKFLKHGKPICYIRFRIDGNKSINEPDDQ
ncbi:MAG: tRNA (guanosine(46)-N7)-methyltransferase TrmB [Marinilabiliales bacterium]|nr:MAG: tRNA (guanosine(46)-N7)-methyltransferase TrmB [Marinilabiliales bacterium]